MFHRIQLKETNKDILPAQHQRQMASKVCSTKKIEILKRHDSIEKTILEGHMPGSRSRRRPKRRWSDDIKEWLNMTGA